MRRRGWVNEQGCFESDAGAGRVTMHRNCPACDELAYEVLNSGFEINLSEGERMSLECYYRGELERTRDELTAESGKVEKLRKKILHILDHSQSGIDGPYIEEAIREALAESEEDK